MKEDSKKRKKNSTNNGLTPEVISRLSGKAGVPVARVSTEGQSDNSLDSQLQVIARFCERRGCIVLEPIRIIGSGSKRSNPEDIVQRIIDRKRSGENIEFVIVTDISRISRTGISHTSKLVDMLAEEGIELVEVASYSESKESNELIQTLNAFGSGKQAKTISWNNCRVMCHSAKEGRRTYATCPPYAVDKLIYRSEDDPVALIRVLSDGSRIVMDPKTMEVVYRYKKKERGFKKNTRDKATLQPGDQDHVDVVNKMFRWFYAESKSAYWIAKTLNAEGIPSPRNGIWTQSTVKKIVYAEVYTGHAYLNRITDAIFNQRHASGPVEVEKKSGVKGIRPKSDWYRQKYPAMKSFLPPDIRLLAIKGQRKHAIRYASGRLQAPKEGNGICKHLLSDILREKTTGLPMKASGGKGGRLYYRPKGDPELLRAKGLRGQVPALPIHRAVLCRLETVIQSSAGFREMLAADLLCQDKANRKKYADVAGLNRNLAKQKEIYKSLLLKFTGPHDELVQESLDDVGRKIEDLKEQIKIATASTPLSADSAFALADRILSSLGEALEAYSEDCDPVLREFVASFVKSATVDLATKEVEVEIAVAPYVIRYAKDSPVVPFGPKWSCETNCWETVSLGCFSVLIDSPCRGDCWSPYLYGQCEDCDLDKHCESCEECNDDQGNDESGSGDGAPEVAA